MFEKNAALAKTSALNCANATGSIHSQPSTRVAPSTTIRAGKIEAQQAEALLIQLAHDDAGDQKARYHEEDIDADEAARHCLREGVKVHHQHHGDGPKAVNIRPISN